MTTSLAPESADVSTEVVLIPQAHGGALHSRGTIGNRGGGRPKDIVRERLAKLANGKGLAFLKGLMEGEVDVHFFGTCPKCQHRRELPDDDEWMQKILDEIGDRASASVDHRLKGMDQALRFGVGTKDEIVDATQRPEVQQFVARLARAVIDEVGEETYQRIAARVQELEA